ncbi:ABC transporter ATP-binding protein [Isoptericola sp. NPDC019693]|uniref:ABC transporter ATP-binding protein n=1 Tax=Isoptericola sp. NPDC019693 TaxID=3364009 RepID=UPI0037A4FD0D
MTSSPAVSIVDLTKTYGQRRALDGVSLDIRQGSRTAVLGHNGAGKSTLLEIVATLRVPTSGTVRIDGRDAVTQARDVRRLIGLTPQSNALDPLVTPAEVLDFQGAALGMGRSAAARRRDELLELLGLAEHRRTRIAKLSGGTRRKVDLAVALVAEPPIVILDEPTTGLDPMSRLGFWDELRRLNAEGRTLLVSTQDLHEADVLATDVVVLRDGKVAAHAAPEALKRQVGERALTIGLSTAPAAHRFAAAAAEPFRPDPDDERTLHLPLADGPDALRAALGDLGAHGDEVTALRLAEPSLDDVFVALAAR